MPRAYRYVGPKGIADRVSGSPAGTVVTSMRDIVAWAQPSGLENGRVTATFVVDSEGRLRLADRRSEHVVCAGGGAVLAADEITLSIRAGTATVEEISNQSTGCCPEPDSWPAVAAALASACVPAPTGYTTELLFRRCPSCGQINIVKDRNFECAVCGAALPSAWNVDVAADA